MPENNWGSVSGCNRSRARKTNVLLKTGTLEYSVGRTENKAPKPRKQRRGKPSPFWMDCPHCDLDNMLSCDGFEGDQLFQITPLVGVWALFHCYKCGFGGFNTDMLLWRAVELMRTVRGMLEAEQ
ncbi:UNVERIFIED_ORG: hypothetical protein GGI57_002320 [Rhizobium aethiopicum]